MGPGRRLRPEERHRPARARPATAGRPGVHGRQGLDANGGGTMTGQLLTAEQLAERWQVPKSQVWRLARDGRIPVVSIGRYRRFRLDAIEAWEAGTVDVDAEAA